MAHDWREKLNFTVWRGWRLAWSSLSLSLLSQLDACVSSVPSSVVQLNGKRARERTSSSSKPHSCENLFQSLSLFSFALIRLREGKKKKERKSILCPYLSTRSKAWWGLWNKLFAPMRRPFPSNMHLTLSREVIHSIAVTQELCECQWPELFRIEYKKEKQVALSIFHPLQIQLHSKIFRPSLLLASVCEMSISWLEASALRLPFELFPLVFFYFSSLLFGSP